MISALPITPGERQAGGDRLGDDDQVRLDGEVLHREHPPRAAEAGLHLVRDQDDPLAVADRAQSFHELRGCGDEAALAELRLEDDRRHLLGGDVR